MIRQASQREDGLAVNFGIIEAIQQMNAAGTRSCQTYTELASILGIATCHKGGCFFMPHLHKADRVLTYPKGLHEAVDAIAGKTKNDLHPPVTKGIDQDVSCSGGHGNVPSFPSRMPLPCP